MYKNAKGKTCFYTIATLPEGTREYYKMLVLYSQAFGGSAWVGIGNAALYSGKQNGDHYEAYNIMVADLKSTVQDFDVVLTNDAQMASMDKQDVSHCLCTFRSTLMWCEIMQDAFEVCKVVRRFKDLAAVFDGVNL